jgi:predicted DNA-binding ArsR family transcriptional regulator
MQFISRTFDSSQLAQQLLLPPTLQQTILQRQHFSQLNNNEKIPIASLHDTQLINSTTALSSELSQFQNMSLVSTQQREMEIQRQKKQDSNRININNSVQKQQQNAHSDGNLTATSPQNQPLTKEERQKVSKMNANDLFSPANGNKTNNKVDSFDKNDPKYTTKQVDESSMETKADVTNIMEQMTSQLKSHVTSIHKTLYEEKAIISTIEDNVEITSFTLVGVNKRLESIVGGAWWDLFTNFAMMITVLIVFAAVMGLIFVVPKAKWL